MAKIEVPYGVEKIAFTVEEDRLLAVLHPYETMDGDPYILEKALSAPLDSPSFIDFLGDAKDVIFIVNDSTRPTPTAIVLESLLQKVPPEVEKSFIVACGTHRQPTREEYVQILGEKVVSSPENVILYNDAKDASSMVNIGLTTTGEEVIINKAVAEASRIVVISSVEPHYFAGYTGGRKSFLPGVAGYDVIEMNHSMAMHPDACTMKLEGNPVHKSMKEFAKVAAGDRTFGVMTVVGKTRNIIGCAAGDLFSSFQACVEIAEQTYASSLQEKAEVVVSVAQPPYDISLYQSQKSLENGRLALKEGGVLILVSACRDGLGPADFYEMLKRPSPQEVLKSIEGSFKLGFQKAAKVALLQLHGDVWALTGLERQTLEDVNIRPVENLQKAVDEALEITGGRLVVMPEGALTVPLVSGFTTCSKPVNPPL